MEDEPQAFGDQESPPVLDDPEDNSAIHTDIAYTAQNTREVAETTLSAKIKLPNSVRAEVEELLTIVIESHKGQTRWKLNRVDKENIVRIAALLMEYNSRSGDLRRRTNGKVNLSRARRAAEDDNIPTLSNVELRVLSLLTTFFENGAKASDDENSRKNAAAFVRLLRKQSIDTTGVTANLSIIGVCTNTLLYKENYQFYDEEGNPVLTKDLIPEFFEQAEQELREAPEDEAETGPTQAAAVEKPTEVVTSNDACLAEIREQIAACTAAIRELAALVQHNNAEGGSGSREIIIGGAAVRLPEDTPGTIAIINMGAHNTDT